MACFHQAILSFWNVSALDRLVGCDDHSRGGGRASDQLKSGDVAVVLEQALAGADYERVDHQQVFVDQAVGDERTNQLAAAHDHEVAARIFFEPGHGCGASLCTSVEFGHSSLVAELLEATNFRALLSPSLNGPPLAFQEPSISS